MRGVHLAYARDRVRDERHAQLVGSRLDRRALLRARATASSACRSSHVAHVQADRTGIVLTEDKPVDRPAAVSLEQEPVDCEVPCARGKICVQCRLADQNRSTRCAAPLRSGNGGSWRFAYSCRYCQTG